MGQYDFTYIIPHNFTTRIIQFLQQKGRNDLIAAFKQCEYEYEDVGNAYRAGIKGDNWNMNALDFTFEGSDSNIKLLENNKGLLKDIIGKQEQYPPMYSAIKVNGKKLYEYARKGQEVEIKPRTIEIYDCKFVDYNKQEAEIVFEISCSKGTYIRTVCENVSKKLNTIGYMKELKRIQVGEFNIKNSYMLNQIKENTESIEKFLISIEDLFKNAENIQLTDKELQLFLNGVKLKIQKDDGIFKIYNNNVFIGTGIVEKSRLKRDVII